MTSLTGADLLAEAGTWPLPERRARRVVRETLAALEGALQDIDRGLHPGVEDRAWSTVESRTRGLLDTLDWPKGRVVERARGTTICLGVRYRANTEHL